MSKARRLVLCHSLDVVNDLAQERARQKVGDLELLVGHDAVFLWHNHICAHTRMRERGRRTRNVWEWYDESGQTSERLQGGKHFL